MYIPKQAMSVFSALGVSSTLLVIPRIISGSTDSFVKIQYIMIYVRTYGDMEISVEMSYHFFLTQATSSQYSTGTSTGSFTYVYYYLQYTVPYLVPSCSTLLRLEHRSYYGPFFYLPQKIYNLG